MILFLKQQSREKAQYRQDIAKGSGGKKGTLLFKAFRVDTGSEQLAEGFCGGVFGVGVIAQLALDVLQQPAVVVAEEKTSLEAVDKGGIS